MKKENMVSYRNIMIERNIRDELLELSIIADKKENNLYFTKFQIKNMFLAKHITAAIYSYVSFIYLSQEYLNALSIEFEIDNSRDVLIKLVDMLCDLFNLSNKARALIVNDIVANELEMYIKDKEVSYRKTIIKSNEGYNWYVDIPDASKAGIDDSPYVNVFTTNSRDKAIVWAKQYLGADEDGKISVISNSN